mmetsp:Transcript_2166/g.5002  ORF Transcript_2166/g.5002 Transcript_2166/m.5002 type:complete len:414 (-) Transcript_2166:326-1567(-)
MRASAPPDHPHLHLPHQPKRLSGALEEAPGGAAHVLRPPCGGLHFRAPSPRRRHARLHSIPLAPARDAPRPLRERALRAALLGLPPGPVAAVGRQSGVADIRGLREGPCQVRQLRRGRPARSQRHASGPPANRALHRHGRRRRAWPPSSRVAAGLGALWDPDLLLRSRQEPQRRRDPQEHADHGGVVGQGGGGALGHARLPAQREGRHPRQRAAGVVRRQRAVAGVPGRGPAIPARGARGEHPGGVHVVDRAHQLEQAAPGGQGLQRRQALRDHLRRQDASPQGSQCRPGDLDLRAPQPPGAHRQHATEHTPLPGGAELVSARVRGLLRRAALRRRPHLDLPRDLLHRHVQLVPALLPHPQPDVRAGGVGDRAALVAVRGRQEGVVRVGRLGALGGPRQQRQRPLLQHRHVII